MVPEKENIPKTMNITAKIILTCTIFFLIIILYQNIENVFLLSIFEVFVYLSILILIMGIMFHFIKFLPEKIFPVLIVIISLLLRLCFIFLVQTPVNSDFLKIYNAAKDAAEGNNAWLGQTYFTTWGYQIPFVYYEAFILRIFGSVFALKLLNAAYMVVTNVLIYLIAKKCVDSRAAFIAAFLYSIYPAPILLSSVLTNQHISLMFFMLSIYFYFVSHCRYRITLSGLFLFFGNLMRPEAMVIIASFLVFTVIIITGKPKREIVKNIVSGTSLLFTIFILLSVLASVLLKVTGAAPDGISNNCPEWKFVVGLDTATNGTYSEKNAHIISIKDSDLRLHEARKAITASLKECKSIYSFFWNKLKAMWANLENTSWSLPHIQKNRIVWSNITYEKVINNILYFDKAVYILLHISIVAACVILWLKPAAPDNVPLFLTILILVNYIVYLLIEIQTRYRYFIMPAFCMLASTAFEPAIKSLEKKSTPATPVG